METIRAVLFDYGMVLTGPPDPMAWKDMQRITGLEESALHREYWAHRLDYDRGTLTGPAYWRAVTAKCDPALAEAGHADLIEADTRLWTQPNSAMVEWAQHLQRIGIRTGVLSNLGDSMTAGVLKKLPWLSTFYHCTWSHTLGMTKPEPGIYLRAAESLETSPANILFIDDRADNIEAARGTGMAAIQYLDHVAFEREIKKLHLGYLLPRAGTEMPTA